MQVRPFSVGHEHKHIAGLGARCAVRGPYKAISVGRQGFNRISKDFSQDQLRPVLAKAPQQDFQDIQREPNPEPQSLPLECDSRQRIPKLEWKEFEEAVEHKNLGKALEALEILNRFESDAATSGDNNGDLFELYGDGDGDGDGNGNGSSLRIDSSRGTGTSSSETFFLPQKEFLKILNICQTATDLQLVGDAYGYLQQNGLLRNFGKYKARVLQAAGAKRVVTAEDMLASSGLDASSLSPKKWGLTGASAFQLAAGFALFSFLVNNNIDIRPLAVIIVGLSLLDSIYLGGAAQAQVLSLWPGYKRRMLVHEAGHVLVAYLLGCPVRGVVLDAQEAFKSGISGQAGTQFWDESLARESEQNRLTEASLDRYCIVLFAGIAAEGLVYGEAEGGESDENLYKGIISGLRPPWGPGRMSNHARWSVLQAFNMLKEHRKVHEAVVQELERGSDLASIVNSIETTMEASRA